jgi:hypothetical protein
MLALSLTHGHYPSRTSIYQTRRLALRSHTIRARLTFTAPDSTSKPEVKPSLAVLLLVDASEIEKSLCNSKSKQNSERTWLKVNVAALTAGDTQNLSLRTNDDCCFRSATTTKSVSRSSADNVLTEGNEKFDLFGPR